ncbi:TetR/AcrR family transcriptional regulator [Cryobacterium sp. Y62]|uniref:TetR/AcrR family transcriptional regulator n=1 Tax=Cryobacterium sp. Y62 TaxID=2048284 RepID=UPI000CE3A7E5|nr:TetR/AcrR family transcriptional regulator [Cryobacterium sp. Y62]
MTRSRTLNRAAVLQAASSLFADRGYHGTSMRDLADALGVVAPSLYNHVQSKQDILVEIMMTTMDRALEAMDHTLNGVADASTRLFRATESLVLQSLRHPDDVTVCRAEIYCLDEPNRTRVIDKRRSYTGRILEIIELGCAETRFNIDVPYVAAFAVVEMGNNAKAWFHQDGGISDIDVARHYGRFALRIVGAETDSILPDENAAPASS